MREYGPSMHLWPGHRRRAVHLMVKADSLPMMLIEIDADAEGASCKASP